MTYGKQIVDLGPAGDAVRAADIGEHEWIRQRIGKRTRIVCRRCRRFYGYCEDDKPAKRKKAA